MDLLSNMYNQTAKENEKNLQHWENYMNELNNLDLKEWSGKLKIPILVPIGKRISFRGELKHPNEVMVALGSEYIVKCSSKQAEEIKQHRLKDAKGRVDILTKEKEFIARQIAFTKENIFNPQCEEIIEEFDEEEDKAWRVKHRQNVKEYMQKKSKEEKPEPEVTDEELWNRLEELELREELDNELLEIYNDNEGADTMQQKYLPPAAEVVKKVQTKSPEEQKKNENLKVRQYMTKIEKELMEPSNVHGKHPMDMEIIHQVIAKQNDLEKKIAELKSQSIVKSKNEEELLAKLDEMEQLEEIEDELDRLEDLIVDKKTSDTEEDQPKPESTTLRRSVTFANEDDSETLQILFKHSQISSVNEPYNPKKGIVKPNDIYEAYPQLFGTETTSILKKSKYALDISVQNVEEKVTASKLKPTIIIKDVEEKANTNEKKETKGGNARPVSYFKKNRMKKKSK